MYTLTITDSTESTATVKLSGELDSMAAISFDHDIAKVMSKPGRKFTIDLSDLTYISSAALRTFLNINRQAQTAGGSIRITGIVPKVLQVFQITGFDKLFEID